MAGFNGLGMHMGNLARLSRAATRSICPESPSGEKGRAAMAETGTGAEAARDLGRGWKINPYVVIEPGQTLELADIRGQGAIQQIWMTLARARWRHAILRFYWDDQEQPSVECPIGDFFACGWEQFAQVSSLAVCVNPGRAFNCYWEMPFRKRARVTMTNLADEALYVYYQINYALSEVSEDAAYFHAQFRRTNPLPYAEPYTILDGVQRLGSLRRHVPGLGRQQQRLVGRGRDQVLPRRRRRVPDHRGHGHRGLLLRRLQLRSGLAGARPEARGSRYQEFTTPYAGLPQVIRPDGVYQSQQRFGMYRWHIPDPIRFERDLRVTIQALGWRTHRKLQYLPLQDDIASVAFWYQTLPTAPFPALPSRDRLEVI